MWDSLQNILPQVASKLGVRRTLSAITIVGEAKKILAEVLPAQAIELVNVRSYNAENHTLILDTAASAAAGILHMHKHKIQEQLNQKFGPHTVGTIKILLK
jgi:hypothetical protein